MATYIYEGVFFIAEVMTAQKHSVKNYKISLQEVHYTKLFSPQMILFEL